MAAQRPTVNIARFVASASALLVLVPSNDMPARMSEISADEAVSRLEQAVARLERAAKTRAAAVSSATLAHARLESRHDRLRTRVQETIGQLDALIAEAKSAKDAG